MGIVLHLKNGEKIIQNTLDSRVLNNLSEFCKEKLINDQLNLGKEVTITYDKDKERTIKLNDLKSIEIELI
ncbi:MAG: hypothetical protein AB2417_01480 [Clostridiaceae bacterium]